MAPRPSPTCPQTCCRWLSKLYAQGGQLADPKQHIYGGLANSPKVKSLCTSNCTSETDAVWKTLLVVTQGWGGNEVFMLDVTTPLLNPQIYLVVHHAGLARGL